MTSFQPLPVRLVRPAWAHTVPAPAHDSLSPAQRRSYLEANPESYLTVTRSPEDLGPDAEPTTTEQLLLDGRQAFERLIDADVFSEVHPPRYYAYRLSTDDHSQTGIIGGVSIADYQSGQLRVHERVRTDRTEHLAQHLGVVRSQSSPIAVSYRPSPEVASILDRATVTDPLLDAEGTDGLRQTVWAIDATDQQALTDTFAEQPTYIIDGHHRASAALAHHLATNGEASAWILMAAFSSDQLLNRAFHRRIESLDIDDVIAAIDGRLAWRSLSLDTIEQRASDEIVVVGSGRWLAVTLPTEARLDDANSPTAQDLANLDPVRLERQLLVDVLGIDPTDSSQSLTYRPGNVPMAALEAETRSGVLFISRPVPVSLLLDAADAGLVLPPKSTYFEPKVRAGVFVRSITD